MERPGVGHPARLRRPRLRSQPRSLVINTAVEVSAEGVSPGADTEDVQAILTDLGEQEAEMEFENAERVIILDINHRSLR